MFTTLDAKKSMSMVDVKQLSTRTETIKLQPKLSDFQGSINYENQRLGKLTRSKNGCHECRRRKKRCDENKPACIACIKANVPCIWRNNKEKSRPKKLKNSNAVIPYSNDLCSSNQLNIQSSTGTPDFSQLLKFPSTANKGGFIAENFELADDLATSANHDNSNDGIYDFKNTDNESNKNFLLTSLKKQLLSGVKNISSFDLKFTISPSSGILIGLGENETKYLNYYRTYVSQTVSILPEESNFFLNLYLPLAEANKSILYALLGWSGLFLTGSKDDNLSMEYLKQSLLLFEKQYNNKGALTSLDKLSLTSLYTILCAALICVGDVRDWYKYFQTLYKFIVKQSNGDLYVFVNNFSNSKESKWLISNFLYHDVLTSVSHEKGTFFNMDQYCEVLNINFESDVEKHETLEVIDDGSVCDPLQGCVRPIYVLIGELSNTYVELKEMKNNLQRLQNTETFDAFIKLRGEYYGTVDEKYKKLEAHITNTKPHTRSLYYLKSDKELELHLTLFEAYKLATSIYLKYLIKMMPPASSEVQSLLLELMSCLDVILGSPVQASLCFPLLIAGMSCIFQVDRDSIEEKIARMSKAFPVKNFQRILVIIKRSWKLNMNGNQCIFWFDICRELGWYLCLA